MGIFMNALRLFDLVLKKQRVLFFALLLLGLQSCKQADFYEKEGLSEIAKPGSDLGGGVVITPGTDQGNTDVANGGTNGGSNGGSSGGSNGTDGGIIIVGDNNNSNSKDTSNASENQEGPSQDTIAKVSNSSSPLTINPLFEKGVTLTQDKKWNEAIEQFQAVLKLDPHHVPSLVNLGISYYEINKKGFSLAYFKKAKTINPSFSAANQALKFLKTKIELKEIPHEIKMQDSFMVGFITPFSLNSFLFFFAICTFASAWLWIDFGAQVKDLKKTRRRLQEFPALKIIVLLYRILS